MDTFPILPFLSSFFPTDTLPFSFLQAFKESRRPTRYRDEDISRDDLEETASHSPHAQQASLMVAKGDLDDNFMSWTKCNLATLCIRV
jgi:hypothetical protein